MIETSSRFGVVRRLGFAPLIGLALLGSGCSPPRDAARSDEAAGGRGGGGPGLPAAGGSPTGSGGASVSGTGTGGSAGAPGQNTDADAGSVVGEACTGRDCASVSFEVAHSSVGEANGQATISVMLGAAATKPVSVDFSVTGGIAYGATGCVVANGDSVYGSGKDYEPGAGTLVFPPGTLRQDITLTIFDDRVIESDETVELTLANPINAQLGATVEHVLTIADDDRKALIDVKKDHGAVADGTTDDTAAIQAAVDAASGAGGAVVLFPPGTYLVTSVTLASNVTYEGYGATLKRPPNGGAWMQTFVLTNGQSATTIIKGLSFDGNSQNQGPYQNYELEHAHQIFIDSSKAVVEDCEFHNGVADGLSVYSGADVTAYQLSGADVFRGLVDLNGGTSTVHACGIVGKRGAQGDGAYFHIESDAGTGKVDVTLDQANVTSLTYEVNPGSTLVATNVIVDGSILMTSEGSTATIEHAKLTLGVADGYVNRLVCPGTVTIADSEVELYPYGSGTFAGTNIWWQHGVCSGTLHDQTVTYRNVRWSVAPGFTSSDRIYLIDNENDSSALHNVLKLEGGHIGKGFRDGMRMSGGGTWIFENVELEEPLALDYNGSVTTLSGPVLSTTVTH